MYKEVDDLVSKLRYCQWGVKPAAQLIKPLEPKTQGVLNLLWIVQDGMYNLSDGLSWFNCLCLGEQIVHQYPVYEWATLFRPPQFYNEIVCEAKSVFEPVLPVAVWKERCLDNGYR